MRDTPFRVSIQDLGSLGNHWHRKIMPKDALHYMPPSGGNWGVVRMALRVPESVVLMAAPPVCARISALRELRMRYSGRFFFLDVGEQGFTSGRYMEALEEAADEILEFLTIPPKVLFLCETCIDDLFGSDYSKAARRIEERHGIIVRSIHLKPLAADGKRPSGLLSILSIFDLLEPPERKDEGLNIIGPMLPPDRESEVYPVLEKAGIVPVRHMAASGSFEEFLEMSKSKWNVMARPAARLAVKSMEKRLGIPSIRLPVSYGMRTIGKGYEVLSCFLDRALDLRSYRVEAEELVALKGKAFKGLTAAVGMGTNSGVFELTRALTEYGLKVRYVFANGVIDFDTEHVDWLKENVPDLMVYTGSHTTMAEFYSLGKTVDIAFGYQAGYFCSGARTVPLDAESQPFGYQAIHFLFSEMDRALKAESSHREMIYDAIRAPGGVGNEDSDQSGVERKRRTYAGAL